MECHGFTLWWACSCIFSWNLNRSFYSMTQKLSFNISDAFDEQESCSLPLKKRKKHTKVSTALRSLVSHSTATLLRWSSAPLFHLTPFFLLRTQGALPPKQCVWCLCQSVCLLSLYLSLQSASSAFNVQLLFLLPCYKMISIFIWLRLEDFPIQLLICFCLWQLL